MNELEALAFGALSDLPGVGYRYDHLAAGLNRSTWLEITPHFLKLPFSFQKFKERLLFLLIWLRFPPLSLFERPHLLQL